MTDRLKQIETIAKACGWEVVGAWPTSIDPRGSIAVRYDKQGQVLEFDPFMFPADWFRAFDAMGLKILTIIEHEPDLWCCNIGIIDMATGPDRLTAMGLALYAAARAKLGEPTP